jgi:hypothetical protein
MTGGIGASRGTDRQRRRRGSKCPARAAQGSSRPVGHAPGPGECTAPHSRASRRLPSYAQDSAATSPQIDRTAVIQKRDNAGLRNLANPGDRMFSTGDRFYDFSLRVLTGFVTLVLLGCIGFLVYRWLQPQEPADHGIPLVQVQVKPSPEPAAAPPAPAPKAEILLAPGKIFRCESKGRVTFSDHLCPEGATQTIVDAKPR